MTIYEEIQAAIDCAWSTNDPQTQQRQAQLIGDSHKPTPEELIFLISAIILSNNT